jgi:Uma2 family endonuclease
MSVNVALPRQGPLVPAPDLGPYRRQDYEALPDEPRCELIWGRFHLSPSPTLAHQLIVSRLTERLDALAQPRGGMALPAPLDVSLALHSVVQPDIVFLRAPNLALLRQHQPAVPDLLVEVLSPGTMRLDRGEKLALYALYGVREYWLVDPEARAIEFLVHDGDCLVAADPRSLRGDVYFSPALDEVSLDCGSFWREISQRLSDSSAAAAGAQAPGRGGSAEE